MMRSKEFLEEIRKSEGLCRAVLRSIEVKGRDVVFFLVTDCTYGEKDMQYADSVASRFVPEGFTGKVRVVKSVPSEEGVRRAVLDFLASHYPATAAFLSPEDVRVMKDATGGRFFITAATGDETLVDAEKVAEELHLLLQREFCGNWYGEFEFKEKEKGGIDAPPPPPEEYTFTPRYFPITEYIPVDGASPEKAIYVADLNAEMQNVTVCGRVTYIEERLTKAGKPFFSIAISDGTGDLRCNYFSKKATLNKVREVKIDDFVCLTGDNELYHGGLSFRVKSLDYGRPPEGFTPVSRPSLPVPAAYRTVFPTPAEDLVQGTLFGAPAMPDAFRSRPFVVFDLETTGLNITPGTGMDRIIEVGAVRIEGGCVKEKFSTFVACPLKLSPKIIELTGIVDDMLIGAPETEDIMPDFFKFCEGSTLVGHNVQFDLQFIRYYGEKAGYIFSHPSYDTCAFSQSLLRLTNYRLETVAAHFGFTFNHHRAFDDAFVTAKIFMELVRMKGGLP